MSAWHWGGVRKSRTLKRKHLIGIEPSFILHPSFQSVSCQKTLPWKNACRPEENSTGSKSFFFQMEKLKKNVCERTPVPTAGWCATIIIALCWIFRAFHALCYWKHSFLKIAGIRWHWHTETQGPWWDSGILDCSDRTQLHPRYHVVGPVFQFENSRGSI